jgi:hypothetical protein
MLMAHGRRAHVGARLAGDGDGRARDRAGEGGESGRGRVRSGPLAWHMGQARPARSMARSGAGPHVAVRHTLPNTDSHLLSIRFLAFTIGDGRSESSCPVPLPRVRSRPAGGGRGERQRGSSLGRGTRDAAAAQRATRQSAAPARRRSRSPAPSRRLERAWQRAPLF